MDLVRLAQLETVAESLHGNQRDLVKLLRSDVPLDQTIRDYIADELEKEPAKRFRQSRKNDRFVARQDWIILKQIELAKYHINVVRDVDIHEPVSDAAALDWLTARGSDLTQDMIGNARKRRKSAKK